MKTIYRSADSIASIPQNFTGIVVWQSRNSKTFKVTNKERYYINGIRVTSKYSKQEFQHLIDNYDKLENFI